MSAPKRMQQITGKHMMMFFSQLEELTKDPYYKMNARLQMALEKINKYIRTTFWYMTQKEKYNCTCQMAEMLILFLGVKSHFESVAVCDQSTDSQREAARQAIAEEDSDAFAEKLRDYYVNREWHQLKSAPLNMEEAVEILQAIKNKYGNSWDLDSVAPSNPDRPKLSAGGSLLDLPPIKWM